MAIFNSFLYVYQRVLLVDTYGTYSCSFMGRNAPGAPPPSDSCCEKKIFSFFLDHFAKKNMDCPCGIVKVGE